MSVFHLAAAALLTIGSGITPGGEHRPDTLRVLFVGNSYTYYNNLPAILEDLGRARPADPTIETGMIVEGGATLLEHAENERTLRAIRVGAWDHVVLQAQSAFGNVHLVNGEYRIVDPGGFYRGATALVSRAREVGARPLLLQHWRRRDAPDRDHRKIAHAFMHLGRRLGVRVAPVGVAWEEVRDADASNIELYAEDGSHPAPGGSYLGAAVLYEVLTGRSPLGLPGEARGPPVNVESGEVVGDSSATLVRLTTDGAETLRTAAHAAVRRLRSAGGYLDIDDPGPPEVPRLPGGRSVDPREITGRWSGPLTVYPYPGTLVLTISGEGEDRALRAKVTFGGQPDDIVIDAENASVTIRGVRFVDPDGPNGGEVRYRGAWTDRGIAGIAEIVVPGAPIYAIGSWSLTREPVDGGAERRGPVGGDRDILRPPPPPRLGVRRGESGRGLGRRRRPGRPPDPGLRPGRQLDPDVRHPRTGARGAREPQGPRLGTPGPPLDRRLGELALPALRHRRHGGGNASLRPGDVHARGPVGGRRPTMSSLRTGSSSAPCAGTGSSASRSTRSPTKPPTASSGASSTCPGSSACGWSGEGA